MWAHAASPKYLSLYSTLAFEVLDSPAYRTALANQTVWSKQNIARFRNMIRAVARITVSRGVGRGSALGLVRIRPAADGSKTLRAARSRSARSGHAGRHHLHASHRERSKTFKTTDR